MITENISTLKIHKLTEKQFNREKEAGNLDTNAIYLTPDEGVYADQTYSPTSSNAQSGKAVAEAIEDAAFYLAIKAENDERYFQITDDGIVSLKPEYRGASNKSALTLSISDKGLNNPGSKMTELPELLVIPETVNENVVSSLAPGMFLRNTGIKRLVLPKTVTILPERFCEDAIYLNTVYNTEHIVSMGTTVFQRTQLGRAIFPLVSTIGAGGFKGCANLVYAEIGNVTDAQQQLFRDCNKLSVIKGMTNLKIVGKYAFEKTYRLRKVDFNINSLTSIAEKGFFKTRLIHDWWNLPSTVSVGTLGTPAQLNPTDFWSSTTVVADKINLLPTVFNQHDPRWADYLIGTGGTYTEANMQAGTVYNGQNWLELGTNWVNSKYGNGCLTFSVFAAYCGLYNKTFTSPLEIEQELNTKYPNWINYVTRSAYHVKNFAEQIGLKVTTLNTLNGTTDGKNNLQIVFDALSAGKYVMLAVGSNSNTSVDHAVLAYGVKTNKEVLISNTDPSLDEIGIYENLHSQTLLQHYCIPDHIEGTDDEENGTEVPIVYIIEKA